MSRLVGWRGFEGGMSLFFTVLTVQKISGPKCSGNNL